MAEPPADDRWGQLIRAFDPERNLRALADLMEQAATASEHVVQSVATPRPVSVDDDGGGGHSLRDAMADLERSFTRLYDAAGRFIVERPLRSPAGPGSGSSAEIAVVDGVGTTVVTIPGATATPHSGELRRHDGARLPASAVTVIGSRSFDTDEPTFVVRVDVDPGTGPGAYYGQLLVPGLPDHATTLLVRVVETAS